MSWRTVLISNRCKLDYSMGYMVIRGEETARIFIDEIAVLMIENPAVSMTGCLLSELTEKKVRIIFCDEKRSPYAELQPYSGCHNASLKIRQQMGWTQEQKTEAWTAIVLEKICNQAKTLVENGHEGEAAMLTGYMRELVPGDATNREGHAAKVYFNAIFGKSFSRNDDVPVNAALNYGYSLILSCVNREIVCSGYLTQLGIFHDNMFNSFNLGCDLMEPFRPIVDFCVKSMMPEEFGKEQKSTLIGLLNKEFVVDGKANTLMNVIKLYVKSVFAAIEQNDASLVKFAEMKYEL